MNITLLLPYPLSQATFFLVTTMWCAGTPMMQFVFTNVHCFFSSRSLASAVCCHTYHNITWRPFVHITLMAIYPSVIWFPISVKLAQKITICHHFLIRVTAFKTFFKVENHVITKLLWVSNILIVGNFGQGSEGVSNR